jgi:glucose 1-dehydrogenase/3-oxoacyl-[acyl-carrier protein] reductase
VRNAQDLVGKVALVTGAGRGIGREIALDLAAHGAAVALNFHESETGAESAADEIRSHNGVAWTCKADISSVSEVRMLIRQVADHSGRLDILVNNAAIDPRLPLFEVTEHFWDTVMNTNVRGMFFCAQSAALEMKKVGRGRIINISSVQAQLVMRDFAAYAASKGAINSLTRQLSLDLADLQITVNAVAPGRVVVEKSTYNAVAAGREIPCKRVGRPGDVAVVVSFLASDATDWLTGQIITVDGGTTTRLFLETD